MCRRQIVSMMSPILARTPGVDAPRDGFRNAESHIFSPAAAREGVAVFEDAGLIEKKAPDGAFVENPEIGQLLRRKVALESVFFCTDCRTVVHNESVPLSRRSASRDGRHLGAVGKKGVGSFA